MSSSTGIQLRLTVALAAGLILGLTACSGHEDTNLDTAAPEPAEEEADADLEQAADEPHDEGAGDIEVEMVDFADVGLPERVPAGTRLSVVNTAEEELHELATFRLPDDEERAVSELIQLPPEGVGPVLGEPTAVLLAAPGGPQISAVGDGTFDEPGRYDDSCFIPTGVAPEVYLAAAAETESGPPQVEGGPPTSCRACTPNSSSSGRAGRAFGARWGLVPAGRPSRAGRHAQPGVHPGSCATSPEVRCGYGSTVCTDGLPVRR